MKALGASQDRYDAHKWHTEAGVLNVMGAKFYNHSEGRGGGGAIDVVEHVAGDDFKGATAYLSARFGAGAAAGAAVAHQTAAFSAGPRALGAARLTLGATDAPGQARPRRPAYTRYLTLSDADSRCTCRFVSNKVSIRIRLQRPS